MFRLNCLNAIYCTILIASFITSSTNHLIEQNANENDLKNSYQWINENLFKRVIQQDYPEKIITITKISLKLIPVPSINYKVKLIQCLIKFDIDNKNLEKSFIIKIGNETTSNIIKSEINNNKQIIPEIKKILHEIGEDYNTLRIYESDSENLYIVLGDPKQNNFKVYGRQNGLSKDHFKVTLKELAEFHAASKMFKDSLINEVQPKKCAVFGRAEITTIIEAFIKLTKNMQGFEHISKKLENSAEKFYQKSSDAYIQDDQSFSALCHGDLCHDPQCTNNIMFQINFKGHPSEALITEHQSICWGPVVIDLASAFYTSSNEKLRADDWDELVQYYHQELSQTLKKLNYTGSQPTLTQLQVQLLERGISFVAVGLFETAERHYTGKNSEGLFEINDANIAIQKRLEILESAKDAEELKYMLHYFDRRGYFDV